MQPSFNKHKKSSKVEAVKYDQQDKESFDAILAFYTLD